MAKALVLTALIVCAVCAPAGAATPESGSVGATTPLVKWEGEAGGYGYTALSIAAGGFNGCAQPFCDTFTLEVRNILDLTITVTAKNSPGFMGVQVTRPDGTKVYSPGEEGTPKTQFKFKSAPTGTWIIEQATNNPAGGPLDTGYFGEAKLEVPAGPPPTSMTPAAPTKLTVVTKSVKVKQARKSLKLALRTSGPVQNLRVRVLKGSRQLTAGAVQNADGRVTMRLKLARALKKGTYRVALVAVAADGAEVTSRASLKVR